MMIVISWVIWVIFVLSCVSLVWTIVSTIWAVLTGIFSSNPEPSFFLSDGESTTGSNGYIHLSSSAAEMKLPEDVGERRTIREWLKGLFD